MANFIGYIQGQRGEASRLGHSSIEAKIATWDHRVRSRLYNDPTGEVRLIVTVEAINGTGSRILFDGPVHAALEKR